MNSYIIAGIVVVFSILFLDLLMSPGDRRVGWESLPDSEVTRAEISEACQEKKVDVVGEYCRSKNNSLWRVEIGGETFECVGTVISPHEICEGNQPK